MAEGDVTQPLLIKDILAKPLLVAPHAEIVSAGHGRFSYREFATRINRLAHALTSIRIGRGDTVAVLDWDTHRYLECFCRLWFIRNLPAIDGGAD